LDFGVHGQRKDFMEQLAGQGAVVTGAGSARGTAVTRAAGILAAFDAQAPLAPLEALGEEGCLRLRELIRPMSVAIAGHLFPR
jgi:glutamate-1-semialdehyde aminotransferase